MAVAVIIQKRAACAPANLLIVNPGFASDICEGPVAVVVKQNVVAPEAAEKIVPSIVVIVPYANAGLPSRPRQAGFFCDVGECSVAIVLKKLRSWRLASRPLLT